MLEDFDVSEVLKAVSLKNRLAVFWVLSPNKRYISVSLHSDTSQRTVVVMHELVCKGRFFFFWAALTFFLIPIQHVQEVN